MKRLLVAGTAFLGLAAWGSAACATPFDFAFTGSLMDFMVPQTGTYQILAFGAQGGSGACTIPVFCFGGPPGGAGGLGAEIGGDFSLTAGENLLIAVGGKGVDSPPGTGSGGGGGGSFVVGPNSMPLIIAGGGGGGAVSGGLGQGGLTGPDGGTPFGPGGAGGTGGNGGGSIVRPLAENGGGGGGGFFSAGADGGGIFTGGGAAFPDLAGGVSSPPGGFGGGGGGNTGAGGAGGYSGGGGGLGGDHFTDGFAGGGGGSFDAGFDQILMADFQSGNGEVVITEVAAPEPASLTLLGSALIGLAVGWRRRQSKT
jgi:PEP-CTERM motif